MRTRCISHSTNFLTVGIYPKGTEQNLCFKGVDMVIFAYGPGANIFMGVQKVEEKSIYINYCGLTVH